MAAYELLQTLQPRRRACDDRPELQVPFEVRTQLRNALVPVLLVFLQSLLDDRLKIAAAVAIQFAQRLGSVIANQLQGLQQRVSADRNRQRTGEQLIGYDAKRVHVERDRR